MFQYSSDVGRCLSHTRRCTDIFVSHQVASCRWPMFRDPVCRRHMFPATSTRDSQPCMGSSVVPPQEAQTSRHTRRIVWPTCTFGSQWGIAGSVHWKRTSRCSSGRRVWSDTHFGTRRCAGQMTPNTCGTRRQTYTVRSLRCMPRMLTLRHCKMFPSDTTSSTGQGTESDRLRRRCMKLSKYTPCIPRHKTGIGHFR